ncbi:DUF6480 family protein [Mycobacterium sp. SMC-4]|uniref:DUF6480 family protein n=1 Tax=Mycobacterium sp. SMC-4 TaxID=2857059 RepID=UPI0028C3CA87|nr:DUF6480 family protein [Mycobacterium sp. SMC-4]
MNTPSGEQGGGVSPGDTPPDSAQTKATANADPTAGRNLNPRNVIGIIAIVAFVLVFAAVAVLLIVQIIGG